MCNSFGIFSAGIARIIAVVENVCYRQERIARFADEHASDKIVSFSGNCATAGNNLAVRMIIRVVRILCAIE